MHINSQLFMQNKKIANEPAFVFKLRTQNKFPK